MCELVTTFVVINGDRNLTILGLRGEKIFGDNSGTIIVSDAERKFDWETEESYFMPHLRFSRTTDVLMRRATTLEFEILAGEEGNFNSNLVRLQDIQDRAGEAGNGKVFSLYSDKWGQLKLD